MNHRIKRILCLLLCAALLAGLTACGREKGTTATYVVKNGVSPYRILIPEDASSQLRFAASDLQFFFKEATGANLEITTQAENVKGKYLSIGETAVFKASGMRLEQSELGNDGYKLLTYGDAVVMAGLTDEASTYAVYGYLAAQFGLEIYGNDIWEITETKEAALADLDVTDVPDILFRCGGNSYSWYGSTKNMSRMRMRTMDEGWGLVTHTYFQILPPSEYLQAHPEWYNDPAAPNELCLSNEEMKAQFIENLKQIILDTPDCIYYMLGHEDGSPFCGCANCQAVRDRYNGVNSALMVLFTNDVVEKINAWAKETIPERTLKFCTFAYTSTEAAPVDYDIATQTYSPINGDEKLLLADNLGIMLAPISSHVSVPYMENGTARATFEGWSVLTDNLYVWGYSAPFSNYLVPFDAFGAYAQNYRNYVEMGAEYVFEQGFISGYVPNFHELRGYLISKLMWDTSLDTDTLVRNFMRNYYGAGWESIYEFFTLWRLRLTELEEQSMYSYTAAQLVQDWCQPELYPKSLLDQYETLFDAALAENEALKETDPQRYEVYRDNIRAERCLIRYLELSIYAQYYDADTYQTMIDEFSDIAASKSFTQYQEGGASVQELLRLWSENLNGR